MRRLLPLFAISLSTAACEPSSPQAGNTTPAQPPSTQATNPDPAPSQSAPLPQDGPKLPAPAPGELASLAKGNNAFAIDLYAKLRQQKGNLAVSPASITTALSMTWAGARGDTAAQMKKVLHAEGTPEQALDVSGKLVASFRDPSKKVTLRIANRLFGEKTYAFEKPYLDRLSASFGAPLEPYDFKGDFEGGRKHINNWVAGETQNRIKDLLPAGALDGNTRLVLTNAIYFLGDWSTPFNKDQTYSAVFHPTPAENKNVQTMHQTEHHRFAAVDGVKVLEMPYQGGELAMTLVLPDAADGIDALEKRLSTAALDGWVSALKSEKVIVSLPKFEIDPPGALSLGETLQQMGMPLAFERGRADFTGIANPPKPEDRLYISKVFHKAFVKLDEKGTEAAAATAVVMARAGAAAPTTQPPEFKADHPFLFFLRDTRSNMILFMGRVADPSAK